MKDFFQNLNFTPTERKVVVTLIGAFLVGLAIRYFRPTVAAPGSFDYAAADSEFAARSAVALPAGAPDSSGPAAGGTMAAVAAPVDLNTAGKSELMTLPGVGAAIADRIIMYRSEHGPFTSVRDLLKVRGIGEKKLERLAPMCVLEK